MPVILTQKSMRSETSCFDFQIRVWKQFLEAAAKDCQTFQDKPKKRHCYAGVRHIHAYVLIVDAVFIIIVSQKLKDLNVSTITINNRCCELTELCLNQYCERIAGCIFAFQSPYCLLQSPRGPNSTYSISLVIPRKRSACELCIQPCRTFWNNVS